jgi:hypothetical protein
MDAGVTSAGEVSVVCTSQAVNVSVPGCYLLQLQLPFCIQDEAESVKFNSRRQPAVLRVLLRIVTSAASGATAAAGAAPNAQQSARAAFKQHRKANKADKQSPVTANNSSSSAGRGASTSANRSSSSSSRMSLPMQAVQWLDDQGLTNLVPRLTGQPVTRRQRPLTWMGLLLWLPC